MKRKEVYQVNKAKYEEYAYKAISEIKALGPECCQSGDDSPLENVWQLHARTRLSSLAAAAAHWTRLLPFK